MQALSADKMSTFTSDIYPVCTCGECRLSAHLDISIHARMTSCDRQGWGLTCPFFQGHS